MPDEKDEPESEESTTAIEAASDPNAELPTVTPPKTKASVQFNQQNNFYQSIPSNAWDRLSPEQVVELSRDILKHMDLTDERGYNFAMDRVRRSEARNKLNLIVGSIVVLVAFVLTAYLATHGHEFVALTISLPLATILAMLLGNRLLN